MREKNKFDKKANNMSNRIKHIGYYDYIFKSIGKYYKLFIFIEIYFVSATLRMHAAIWIVGFNSIDGVVSKLVVFSFNR